MAGMCSSSMATISMRWSRIFSHIREHQTKPADRDYAHDHRQGLSEQGRDPQSARLPTRSRGGRGDEKGAGASRRGVLRAPVGLQLSSSRSWPKMPPSSRNGKRCSAASPKRSPTWPKTFMQMVEKKMPDDLEGPAENARDQEPDGNAQLFPSRSERSWRTCCRSCIGGSADLSGSDMTMMKKFPLISPRAISAGATSSTACANLAWRRWRPDLPQTDMIVPLHRDVSHLFRLHAQRDPPCGSLQNPGDLPVHPRFDFPRGRWPHAPADRALALRCARCPTCM